MDLYKELWKRIGGRPWTYIIRDAWHEAEFLWIVAMVSLGIWLGDIAPVKLILIGWLIFATGYLAGHLFWGTEYIPHQQGDAGEKKTEEKESNGG